MKSRNVLSMALALFAFASIAFSAPRFVNFQGVLEFEAEPLEFATVDVTFRLYNVPELGDVFWEETILGIETKKNGRFDVKLGKAPGSEIPDSVFSENELWLGIQIINYIPAQSEMTPRTEIGSVPLALMAKTVPDKAIGKNKLDTLSVDSSKIADKAIRKENIQDKAIGKAQLDTLAVDSSKIADKAIRKENIKDKAVGKAQLDTLAVDSAKIADKGIRKENIQDKAVGKEQLEDDVFYWVLNIGESVLRTASDWGLARSGNVIYGVNDSTHTNFGVACTTGVNTEDIWYATTGGGCGNTAAGSEATVSGGKENTAYGQSATVGGGFQNRANGEKSTIGGGTNNEANYNAIEATIGGGVNNYAGGQASTISGGQDNQTTGQFSVVCGGSDNIAGGFEGHNSVGGGAGNKAEGLYATVPGGIHNSAEADNSFAAGTLSKAQHKGSIVIAANSGTGGTGVFDPSDSVWTDRGEQLVLRADSGFYLTNISEQAQQGPGGPGAGNRFMHTVTGAGLSQAGQWQNNCDRNHKENFTEVDRQEILNKIAAIPITQWNYKIDDDTIIHIGPVAQDFFGAFGIGEDDKTIAAIDAAGVALVAIQELYKKTQRIDLLESQIADLQEQLKKLLAEKR